MEIFSFNLKDSLIIIIGKCFLILSFRDVDGEMDAIVDRGAYGALGPDLRPK